ncbi:hypothetical protein KR084_009379, partial [Drosophila pseudotakahashii]
IMAIDPVIMEKYLKRTLRLLLASLARILIVSNFVAHSLCICRHFYQEQSTLNITWHCGYLAAGVYITLLAMAQLTASLLIVALRQRFVATGILWLAAHLRMAANPALWSLTRYMELCALISALLVIMLKSQRQAVVTFLLFTYLNCKDLERLVWLLLCKCVLKHLLSLVIMGFRMKRCTGVVILLIGIHCLDTHIWRGSSVEDNSPASRDLQHFNFWHKVAVTGGLLLTAFSRQYHCRT